MGGGGGEGRRTKLVNIGNNFTRRYPYIYPSLYVFQSLSLSLSLSPCFSVCLSTSVCLSVSSPLVFICSLIVPNSRLQKFKTRHDCGLLCYDIRLFNFMFLLHYPIWVEEEYKKRKRREHVRENNNNKKQTNKNTQTNKNNKKDNNNNKNKQKNNNNNNNKHTFRCKHFSNCVVLCFW